VVRALIQHGWFKSRPMVKVYYFGPMFRYERPQAGRQRQFHQVGQEFFGVEGPEADAEVIAVNTRYLEALGFTGVRSNVNTLGTPEERRAFNVRLREYLAKRVDDLDPDSRRRLDTNPLRILDSKEEKTQAILDEAPALADCLGADSKRHFEKVLELLDAMGIQYEVRPRLVRGLDYYTKTVFETTLPGLGAQDAVLGGGRYDNLVADLGGPTVAATGAAIGMERLALALKAAGLGPPSEAFRPDVYLVVPDEGGLSEAARCADLWRRVGLRVRWDATSRSLRAGMKAANKANARFAALLGEEERAQGKVALKDLGTGDQRLNTPDQVLQRILATRKNLSQTDS
jgi:histidyl-tRNA synthetase